MKKKILTMKLQHETNQFCPAPANEAAFKNALFSSGMRDIEFGRGRGTDMGGMIGVLLELSCAKAETAAAKEVSDLAHMICLHIAANSPKYICPSEIPQEEVDTELEIKLNALKEQKGKLPPEQALVGIKKGMAAKFASQICLLKQGYVADDKQAVEDVIAAVAKNLGDEIKVARFVRLQLGA
jgi:elongation factor Ts